MPPPTITTSYCFIALKMREFALGCGNTLDHTTFASLSPFANIRRVALLGYPRFSSNCSMGEPEVTSMSPSTMAPLAIAMVRALTLPRITAV